jgi:hypothetical protein
MKKDPTETGVYDVDYINLFLDRGLWHALVNMVMKVRITYTTENILTT